MYNKTGLRMVVDAVKNTKDDEFDMGKWKSSNACEFAGCAVGSFCHLNPNDELKMGDNNPMMPYKNTYIYNWKAVTKRFGLSMEAAQYLFGKHRYKNRSRQNVMRRINKFIKTGKTPKRERTFGA
jgi:hypothetical protein